MQVMFFCVFTSKSLMALFFRSDITVSKTSMFMPAWAVPCYLRNNCCLILVFILSLLDCAGFQDFPYFEACFLLVCFFFTHAYVLFIVSLQTSVKGFILSIKVMFLGLSSLFRSHKLVR